MLGTAGMPTTASPLLLRGAGGRLNDLSLASSHPLWALHDLAWALEHDIQQVYKGVFAAGLATR